MRIQFIGRISELLTTLRVILADFPTIRAADVTPRMLAEARLSSRWN